MKYTPVQAPLDSPSAFRRAQFAETSCRNTYTEQA